MRNIFYLIAALVAFGAAFYYYQDVSAQTATVQKLRLVGDDGTTFKAGTVIDETFIKDHIVGQQIPRSLVRDFRWALDDTAVTRVNLEGQVLGQDVAAGNFLQRAHLTAAHNGPFAQRIRPGYRAFSIPVGADRAVENFLEPGARVDVVGTFEVAQNTFSSRVILENVEVMAVEGYDSQGAFGVSDRPTYNSITLQAPADAVVAFLADAEAASAALTLVLRNPCDTDVDCVGVSQ
ncbi:MAG: Flp pilus assembly protein CpaB [Pseudomonadota bacterium]